MGPGTLAFVILLALGLFSLLMLGVALRFGPRRGYWNQPAAALRRPGRFTFIVMYLLAIAHLAGGVGLAIFTTGDTIAILLVSAGMAAFYVACAHVYAIGVRVFPHRPDENPPREAVRDSE